MNPITKDSSNLTDLFIVHSEPTAEHSSELFPGLRNLVMPSHSARIDGIDIFAKEHSDPSHFAAWFETDFGATLVAGRVGRAMAQVKELASSLLVASFGVASQAVAESDPTALLHAANRYLSQDNRLECNVHVAIVTWDSSECLLASATAGTMAVTVSGVDVCVEQPPIGFGQPITQVPTVVSLAVTDTVSLENHSASQVVEMVTLKPVIELV